VVKNIANLVNVFCASTCAIYILFNNSYNGLRWIDTRPNMWTGKQSWSDLFFT